MTHGSPHTRQMIGSLLLALAIVGIVIVAVTARLGPTSVAELDSREKRQKEALKAREDRLDARLDAREKRLKER